MERRFGWCRKEVVMTSLLAMFFSWDQVSSVVRALQS